MKPPGCAGPGFAVRKKAVATALEMTYNQRRFSFEELSFEHKQKELFMKGFALFFAAAAMALCVVAAPRGPRGGKGAPPPRHNHGSHHRNGVHHHHKHSKSWSIGAGILGAGLIASTIYDATHPDPIVVTQPTVVAPAPVVVAPAPVVVTPASVVVQQPVAAGRYETRLQNVWVEGRYVDQVVNGVVQRVWQPGHYEQQQTQVWVSH